MRLRGLTLPVTLIAALVLATGCGEDDTKSASSPSSVPSITGPGVDPSTNFSLGEEFVGALAGNTAESLAGAMELVAPRSSAARYLKARGEDLAEGAQPLTQTKVSEGTYRLCAGTTCTVISDLVLADGKVSSFKVDGKQAR